MTPMVRGGRFNRSNDLEFPAMVSDFALDRFEVTVGRFRKFVEAYPGSKPATGAGAHPRIDGSGWDPSWDGNLPTHAEALKASVKCDPDYHTWADEAGEREHLPMNCLNWYVAFAFCAWDGGRLPTEAEWNYAAAAGGEQRFFPWSSPPGDETIDPTYAVYGCTGDGSAEGECTRADILSVGSRSPAGDGRWWQADLSGNVGEWVLDWFDLTYDSERGFRAYEADPRLEKSGVVNGTP